MNKRDLENYKRLIVFVIDNYNTSDFETLAWLFEKYTETKIEVEREEKEIKYVR